MPCPNCAKQTSPDQKFCRFCGAILEAASEIPPAHPVISPNQKQAKVTVRMPARRLSRLVLWGVIVISVGVTLLANSQGSGPLDWLGILIFLAGIGLAIFGTFFSQKAKTLTPGQPSQSEALNQSQDNLQLPPKDYFEPAASITERTTELLDRQDQ